MHSSAHWCGDHLSSAMLYNMPPEVVAYAIETLSKRDTLALALTASSFAWIVNVDLFALRRTAANIGTANVLILKERKQLVTRVSNLKFLSDVLDVKERMQLQHFSLLRGVF